MFSKSKMIFAAAAGFSLLMSHVAAHAGAAQAKAAVNVRSGPGIKYQKVDVLHVGEVVDATECNQYKWCYVKHEGANGWVSAKYLTAVHQNNGITAGDDCKFTFSINNNSPSFKMECEEADNFNELIENDDDITVFNPQHNATSATACLYTGINFTGAEICEAISIHNNLRGMNDIFASVKLYNGASIKLCTGSAFGGECRTYSQDKARLDTPIYKKVSSMQIFPKFREVNTVPRLPDESGQSINRLAGQTVLRRGQRLDLDTGVVGRNGADLQSSQSGNGRLYLRVLNGASIAMGRRSDKRGLAGCRRVKYNRRGLSQVQMPVGSYICVKTSEGRLSQFMVNKYGASRMHIEFETF